MTLLNIFNVGNTQREGFLGKPSRLEKLTKENIFDVCKRLTTFNRYKFITMRPHIQYIIGRYFQNKIPTRKEYAKKLIDILKKHIEITDGIDYIAGSIEKNDNDPFAHFHFILECSNKNLEILKKLILDDITIDHKISKKQYAWKLSKCTDGRIDKMIKYYLGVKENPKSNKYELKPSYEYSLINYDTVSDTVSDKVYLLKLEAYKTNLTGRQIKSVARKQKKELINGDEFYNIRNDIRKNL